jgi:23S rRNA pseudouridine2605 synthase
VVLDLVSGYERLVRPVGRLDLDSSGLLLLTNDGELAFRLSHPRYKIDKKYMVKCEGSISKEKLAVLGAGVELEDGRTWPATVELIERRSNFTRFHITMHEGRKRQIRRMCDAVGHRVVSLRRIEYGGMKLGKLKSGSYRRLGKKEIEDLKSAVGL